MTMVDDLELFNTFAEMCGNRYVATRYMINSARKLSKQLPRYHIESKLIRWVLLGETPDLPIRMSDDIETQYIVDLLEYVSDEEVKECVIDSYRRSVLCYNLTYQYDSIDDEYRQARVRILTRMAWYGSHEGGDEVV